MKPIRRVFISGPYTSNPEENVQIALGVAEQVAGLKLVPFVPHLYHFWDAVYPHHYVFWTEQDVEWLKVCDALYRIPGRSSGADEEVQIALNMGLPVFRSMEELRRFVSQQMTMRL